MKRNILILLTFFIVGFTFAAKKPDGIYFKILTNRGLMEGELFYKQTPLAVCNFIGLAEGTIQNKAFPLGKPFYDGLTIYKVNKDKFIQTGNPFNEINGTNGSGYYFHDEIDSAITHNVAGLLGYSNQGPNTNSSEIYITKKPMLTLDYKYTIFGKLTAGYDVLYKILPNDTIYKVQIIRVGKEANAFKATTESFQQLQYAQFQKKEAEKKAVISSLNNYVNTYYKGADSLSSGLRVFHEIRGTGKKVTSKCTVQIRYFGFLQDSTIIDQSDTSGIPKITYIGVGKLTRGLEQGIKEMNEGGVAYIFIPYTLAYGETGYKNFILPRTNLIYRVELVSVKEDE